MSTLAATNLKHASSASNNIVLDSSGNVGIGTSSPDATRALTLNRAGNYGGIELRVNGSPQARIQQESTGSLYIDSGITTTTGSTIFRTANGSERMRIDSSGNVGIGTSSPTNTLSVNGSMNASNYYMQDSSAAAAGTYGFGNSNGPFIQTWGNSSAQAGALLFATSGTERARITSGGEFLVGVSSGNGVQGSVGALGYQVRSGRTGSFSGNLFNINWTGSAQLWIDTTNVGTITLTSDYRIKRNIETQDQPALDRVLQLRPVTYQMADYGDLIKASDDIREGFIAHELAAVIPSAVSGEKDAPDQLQSLKIDALCSVLVKAIQELKAENDDLKGRLTALEAK